MIKLNSVEVKFEKFPNNELLLSQDKVDELLNTVNNTVTLMYESNEDLIKLIFLKKHLDFIGSTHSKLLISYMPYSRMDRTENHSVFTLKYVSEIINSLKFDKVHIFEPHSNVTSALINNSMSLYINQGFVEYLLHEFKMDKETDYIMFPDNGAANRYKNLKFKNILIGHKNRDFETGEIKNLDIIGEVKNPKKVLIVDDLSSYGGTFVHSSIKLRELGFEEVNLYVSHAENSIFKGELFKHIDNVITSDSILTEQNNWENRKYDSQLEVLPFEKIIGKWEF